MSARFLAIVAVGLLVEAWSRHQAGRWSRWKGRVSEAQHRKLAAELGVEPFRPNGLRG